MTNMAPTGSAGEYGRHPYHDVITVSTERIFHALVRRIIASNDQETTYEEVAAAAERAAAAPNQHGPALLKAVSTCVPEWVYELCLRRDVPLQERLCTHLPPAKSQVLDQWPHTAWLEAYCTANDVAHAAGGMRVDDWAFLPVYLGQPALAEVVCECFALCGALGINGVTREHVHRTAEDVLARYRSVAYHNAVHAVVVVHGVALACRQLGVTDQTGAGSGPFISRTMAQLTLFAALFHDIEHPGVGNGTARAFPRLDMGACDLEPFHASELARYVASYGIGGCWSASQSGQPAAGVLIMRTLILWTNMSFHKAGETLLERVAAQLTELCKDGSQATPPCCVQGASLCGGLPKGHPLESVLREDGHVVPIVAQLLGETPYLDAAAQMIMAQGVLHFADLSGAACRSFTHSLHSAGRMHVERLCERTWCELHGTTLPHESRCHGGRAAHQKTPMSLSALHFDPASQRGFIVGFVLPLAEALNAVCRAGATKPHEVRGFDDRISCIQSVLRGWDAFAAMSAQPPPH